MAITLKIEGRANGGYKLTYQNVEYEVRNLRYIGYPGAVTVWADELWGNKKVLIFPAINIPVAEIQVGETTNYETSQAVCTALDTLIAQITAIPVTIASGVELEIKNDLNNPLPVILASNTDGSQKAQWVDSALVEKGDIIRTFKVTITLPNNTNPYSAGDVITDISGALSQLTNVAKAAGYGVTILGVRVQTTDASGLAGKNLRWHIFNDSITPIADNTAFAINDANTDKREGTITVTMGTGAFAKVGQSNYENLSLNPVGRNIYLVCEHADGGTPSANSTVINAYFKCLLYN